DDPVEWDTVPNLAIEVISPTNTVVDLAQKIEDYFRSGVQVIWVLYPKQRMVHVWASPTQIDVVREQDELDGGSVLPGFRLRVATLFEPLVKPVSEARP